MAKEDELRAALLEALRADMTLMLGLDHVERAHMRPMTAQLLDEQPNGPLWFFTSRDTELAKALADGSARPAHATFADKGHEIFATLHGPLQIDNNRAVIDKLWSPFVATWFEQGKDDPKLTLLRFDAREAEVWRDASSLLSGIKMLFGFDPKEEYRDKVGSVRLG